MHWTRSGSGSCMRAMPRSETVREPQEVLFVQHAVGTVLSQIWIVFARMDGQVSPASHRGSTDPPPHQEMAEGRRTRGWRVVGNEKGDSARLGDFTAALQRLPSLWRARINLVLPAGEIPAPLRGVAASPGIESWVRGGNESD